MMEQPTEHQKKVILLIKYLYYGQMVVVLMTAIYFAGLHLFFGFEPSGNHYTFLLILIVFLISMNIYFLWKNQKYIDEVEKKGSLQEEAYHNIENLNKALRMQRHDFLNHIQILYSLMEMEEYEETNKYLNTLYQDVNRLSAVIKTKSVAVNALLQAKANEAEKMGIQLDLAIESRFDQMNMPDWEVCRVLSNLMDNAFEAAESCPNKNVSMTLSEQITGYELILSNSCRPVPETIANHVFEAGVTSKTDDKDNHGMGMAIVKELLEKYENEIDFKVLDQAVEIKVAIKKITK